MPPPIRRGLARRDPELELPARVAIALRPSANLAHIPPRATLSSNTQPYGGELREDQTRFLKNIPASAQVLAVGLRRPWTFVGFAVDPGDVVVGGFSALLKVITTGVQGFFAPVPIVSGGGPQAFAAQIVGARVELWLLNKTAVTAHNVRASLWGMSER